MPRAEFDCTPDPACPEGGRPLHGATDAVEPIFDAGWVVGAKIQARRRPRGRAERDPRPVRDRCRWRREPIRRSPRGSVATIPGRSGIAARRYYRTDYHPGPWFESWLDLWEGDLLLPGYGWLFPVAGGQINLGAGLLNTFKDFKQISAQRLFDAFAGMLPAEWEISEETAEGRVLSGPLPMGLNRVPQAVPGHAADRRRGRGRQPIQRRRHRLRDGDRPRSPPS